MTIMRTNQVALYACTAGQLQFAQAVPVVVSILTFNVSVDHLPRNSLYLLWQEFVKF